MKAFMLVAMLVGLLVTAWLVARDLQERAGEGRGPAAIKAIDRAQEARQKAEAGNEAQRRLLEGMSRE